MVHRVETLTVGAGVIGSSVAMHLAKMGMTDIRVIDFDLEGSLSSSELNAGGVRATWKVPIHIEMSKVSIDYFASVAEAVGYRDCGYLWLHSPESWDFALDAREGQVARGWPVEVWGVSELQKRRPFLDKLEGVEGALFSPRDGLINPNLLKNHFREVAKNLGVVFEDRTLLRAVQYPKKRNEAFNSITVIAEKFPGALSQDQKKTVLSTGLSPNSLGDSLELESPTQLTQIRYQTQRVINCAGPWASHVAKVLGYKTPAFPLRRQVSIFDCRELDLSSAYGMIVDTSGVYFHPEATHVLAGLAQRNEPHGINFAYDGEEFFNTSIWPALYERSTFFEKLKHVTGWAGLYEVSPDECAILGPVSSGSSGGKSGGEAGRNGNVFECHSFSGHGVMHSYGAGLALAEKILKGRFETLDATVLSAKRFETGQLLCESLVI